MVAACQNNSAEVLFPEKMNVLFVPKRYKIFYGGRGGSKSWNVARALLIKGRADPLRVLCCREFQNSIKDSVHRLLEDQIKLLGLEYFYDVQQSVIRGLNGTTFNFEGIKRNANNIKSYEAVDIAWVEEAQLVSKSSWEVLIPTIRKAGSEIWITFNPQLEEDETYQRFVVRPPKNSFSIEVNWRDNPWFPDVLMEEMLELKERDTDAWLNVWEGKCKEVLEGAIFGEQYRKAKEEGRITRVPWDPTFPVDTYWDLGYADFTSIWFVQTIAMEFRVIDFMQDHLRDVPYYNKELQKKAYQYRMMYLPHDAKAKTLAAGGRSIEKQIKAGGYKTKIVPKMARKANGIAAARAVFPLCWFDQGNCSEGLQSLRHYRYDFDEETQKYSREPMHDWASHAADGFQTLGVAIKTPKGELSPSKSSPAPARSGYAM